VTLRMRQGATTGAAVLLGAPVATEDLDIVHRRTPENVDRLASEVEIRSCARRF